VLSRFVCYVSKNINETFFWRIFKQIGFRIILRPIIPRYRRYVSVDLLEKSLMGFLFFNFTPAKIFLGDSGSLIVGLIIAVATIRTTYYHQDNSGTWFNALMPLIVLAVPLYDFISVVIIRWLAGDNPFVGDNRHFSHRLVKRGMTHRQAVLTIYLATACCGLGATFLYQLSLTGAILVFGQTVMILLIIAILEKPPQANRDD